MFGWANYLALRPYSVIGGFGLLLLAALLEDNPPDQTLPRAVPSYAAPPYSGPAMWR